MSNAQRAMRNEQCADYVILSEAKDLFRATSTIRPHAILSEAKDLFRAT